MSEIRRVVGNSSVHAADNMSFDLALRALGPVCSPWIAGVRERERSMQGSDGFRWSVADHLGAVHLVQLFLPPFAELGPLLTVNDHEVHLLQVILIIAITTLILAEDMLLRQGSDRRYGDVAVFLPDTGVREDDLGGCLARVTPLSTTEDEWCGLRPEEKLVRRGEGG